MATNNRRSKSSKPEVESVITLKVSAPMGDKEIILAMININNRVKDERIDELRKKPESVLTWMKKYNIGVFEVAEDLDGQFD